MPIALSEQPNERSTLALQITFADEDGASVIPTAATWSLRDGRGRIVNDRENVAISLLAASITILLSGPDLAIGTGIGGADRVLTISSTYTSDLGSNLPSTEEVSFTIADLQGVS